MVKHQNHSVGHSPAAVAAAGMLAALVAAATLPPHAVGAAACTGGGTPAGRHCVCSSPAVCVGSRCSHARDHAEMDAVQGGGTRAALSGWVATRCSDCKCGSGTATSDAAGNVRAPPITALGELHCGVLWFLHIPKTGGGTTRNYLADRTRPRKAGQRWLMVDLYSQHCHPALFNESMDGWGAAPVWADALSELARPHPRLVIHQHHCSPGLASLIP